MTCSVRDSVTISSSIGVYTSLNSKLGNKRRIKITFHWCTTRGRNYYKDNRTKQAGMCAIHCSWADESKDGGYVLVSRKKERQ